MHTYSINITYKGILTVCLVYDCSKYLWMGVILFNSVICCISMSSFWIADEQELYCSIDSTAPYDESGTERDLRGKKMPKSSVGTELPMIDNFKHFPKQIQQPESTSKSNHEKCSVCRELCLRSERMFKIRGAVRLRAPRVLSVPVPLSCWLVVTVT